MCQLIRHTILRPACRVAARRTMVDLALAIVVPRRFRTKAGHCDLISISIVAEEGVSCHDNVDVDVWPAIRDAGDMCPLTNPVESLRQPRFVGDVLQRSARAFRTLSHCVGDVRLTRSRFFWGGVSVAFPIASRRNIWKLSRPLIFNPEIETLPPHWSPTCPQISCSLSARCVRCLVTDTCSSSGYGSSSDILELQCCAVDHYRCRAATVASLRRKGNILVF